MFKYTPEDVDCRNCIEFKRKGGCASVHCPYVAERVEAGVVGYDEAVAETFRSVPAIRLRLVYMVSTFPGTLWYDEGHERRMLWSLPVRTAARMRTASGSAIT